MNTPLEGLIVAPLTAFDAAGELNLDIVEKQAAFYAQNGVSGAFICGTTGESMLLTVQERMRLAERWTAVAPGGFKVIVHAGHAGLKETGALCVHAQKQGAWGVGVMPPFFFRADTVETLIAYYRRLASLVPDLPLYYYHIPELTGVRISMEAFLKSAAGSIPNLAGVKYTSLDLMEYRRCRQVEGGRFDMVYGVDEQMLAALSLGAKGMIGSTYNYAAPLYTQLIRAFEAGDMETARSLQDKSIDLVRILQQAGSSFNAASKAVMEVIGLSFGPVREPQRQITDLRKKELRTRLEAAGLFDYCSKGPIP